MPWSKTPATFVSERASRHARTLRRVQTEPEKKLWWHLRHRLLIEGTHFRRQVPIDTYIADFCCLTARLIVELDGNQHGMDRHAAYDRQRTVALEQLGFRVIRFSNDAVLREIDSVLDTIAVALASGGTECAASGTTPTPGPSPQGGGE